MAKRSHPLPLVSDVKELLSRRKLLKISVKPQLVHEDTYESISQSNSNLYDTGNETTSESEFDDHPYSAQNNKESRPSSSDNTVVNRKRPRCTSKNAVMARINRIKKKKYIEGLETRTAQLEVENKVLKGNLNKRTEEVVALKREILNLKNVIKNSTEIGSLLKCINQNTNLKISSSILNLDLKDTPPSALPNVLKHESRDSARCSLKDMSMLSSSDEEGNCARHSPTSNLSPSLLKHNPTISPPSCSPNGVLDDFDFDNNSEPNHYLLSEFETKVSRFELPDPKSGLGPPHFGSDMDDVDLARCETPSKGIDSGTFFEDTNLFFNLGVCLHVANKQVSLEFCDSCNQKASLSK